ncbi:IclR family transcriptional regulator C-terminal domain-containing protein [Streptomyces sp. YIM 130001]|uniref:IclR family transcriptional regulator domain-containing protein n=1 Tax=Streptomyces sp. YIM 130001 TaxID=2259644 RepID=UPI001F0900F8|nr:IclR family transcriptional regulator C-terminal domain-containing protein [Streptomyces sp. YIM 130001]
MFATIRRNGFALNQERSEGGVVAIGVPVRTADGIAVAGLSVSMPGVRYDPHHLRFTVRTLRAAADDLEHALTLDE